jgi:hemerythrin-like domain-containing protein
MKAIDILMAEHRTIERVLDALEIAADNVARGTAVRPGFFLDAAEFIAGYADGCHHHKEEDVLFGALGGPETQGAVEMMLDEHREARRLTQGMRDAARRLATGDDTARASLVSTARQYVALLRDHIEKEDEMLFPMADELLQAEQRDEVARNFERIVGEEAGSPERFKELAEKLAAEAKGLGAA